MNEEEIFHRALARSPEERVAYLELACAGDRALRVSVENLLRANVGASGYMDGPADGLVAPVEGPPLFERPGSVLGPYKLLRQIGEGGMGTVFLAEQTQPVHRQVALKVIKAGMDSRQVIGRFEVERQTLALMDHPNIAKVLDGGATPAGRPFFVMELVHGVPMTKYCDDNRLTPRERLELFIPVCQAIQHAHQKGIIHRDIKPSNVMITLYDGKPVPKVIDFGVAKATEQKLTERTLFTQSGTFVGTYEYMSPEQAELSAGGVDTRSDIYSLGVLLYELLTGSTPLSGKRMKEAAYAEILRLIKEEEPPTPSTRLSDSGESLASISAQRHMEPGKLTKLVRGELDWIVMKTLEKDRNRRYETANSLSADVLRYLNDEPVQACPPSTRYKLRKFARRNRVAIWTTGIVTVALLLGTLISTWQAVRATLAGNAARDSERAAGIDRDTAVAEKDRADEEAAIAKAVNDFLLNDLLAEAAPEKNARAKQVTVEELLGRAAARIAGKFDRQPRIEAAVRQTIGDAYRKLGGFAAAEPHQFRALEIRRRVLGEDHPDTLTSMNNLALLYKEQGQLAKAQPILIEALEGRRRVLGEEHPDTIRSTINLAGLYMVRGMQLDKAEPLLVKALEVSPAVLGEEHPDRLLAMNNLAVLYKNRGQVAKAEPLFVDAVAVGRRSVGEGHPDTLRSMHNLAELYASTQKLDRAVPLYEETLRLKTARLGPDHPSTLLTMIYLGVGYLDAARPADAIPVLDNALGRMRQSDSVPFELVILPPLVAEAYERAGLYAKAEPLRREALDKMRNRHGMEAPPVAGFLYTLGLNLAQQKRHDEAEPLLRTCLKIREANLPGDWKTFTTQSLLGGCLLDLKKYAEAEPMLLTGYEGMKRVEDKIPATGKSQMTAAVDRLVKFYEATGNEKKAAAWRKLRDPVKVR